mgnify:CR=1 FL=1
MTESRMQGFAAGRYAAIDIGTVTCRMLVADVDAAGAIHEVDREYAITNLGEGVDATGMLLPAAIDRTVETVEGYCAVRDRLAEQGAPIAKTIAVATSASRDAGNSDEFVRRLAELGVVLSVIPGWKEAGLSFSGASCDFPGQDLMVVDIGGGSTELTRVEGGRDSDDVSLGQGSLSSFARFVRNILPVPIEMDAIACEFRGNLRRLPSLEPYKASTLYGVGGSTRAAAKLVQQLDELQTRPREIQAEQVQQILEACRENPSAFGHAALKASAERVHTMVPGCVILAELFRHLGADKLVICKHGVREGYLVERMLGAVSAPPQAD